MTGQAVAFTAFGIPFALLLVFRARPVKLLAAGCVMAVALLALAAAGHPQDGYGEVPIWITIVLIVWFLAIWCAGVGAGAFVRRRLFDRRA